MRTPALVFVAVVALTPVLVGCAPFPGPGTYSSDIDTEMNAEYMPASRIHPIVGTKQVREPQPDHSPSLYRYAK